VDELTGISVRPARCGSPNGPRAALPDTGASMPLDFQCADRIAGMSYNDENRSELINKYSSENIDGVRTSLSKSSKALVGEYLACIISTTTRMGRWRWGFGVQIAEGIGPEGDMLGIEATIRMGVGGTGIVDVVKTAVLEQCKIYNNPQLRSFGWEESA
jgi:hypothetical protein